MNRSASITSKLVVFVFTGLVIGLWTGDGFAELHTGNQQRTYDGSHVDDSKNYPFSTMPIWDDGLCEMSYYRTTTQIYNNPRTYTRVQLLNRQWMDPGRSVKTDLIASDSIPVFKLNIVEEIPTENYNHRYQTTVFVRRANLKPFKMTISTQEWCGTTFKHLQWSKLGVTIQSFSYQENEGVKNWRLLEDAIPYESLSIIARNVAATGKPVILDVLLPMRATKEIKPELKRAVLKPGPELSITVEAGKFQARRVDMTWEGPLTGFLVESKPPFRLLRFRNGLTRGELLHVERRAYWDATSKSSFYPTNQAP